MYIYIYIDIYVCILLHLYTQKWHTYLKSFLIEVKDLPLLHSDRHCMLKYTSDDNVVAKVGTRQYSNCRWPVVRFKSDPLAAFSFWAQRGFAALGTKKAARGSDLNRTRWPGAESFLSICQCLHMVPWCNDICCMINDILLNKCGKICNVPWIIVQYGTIKINLEAWALS